MSRGRASALGGRAEQVPGNHQPAENWDRPPEREAWRGHCAPGTTPAVQAHTHTLTVILFSCLKPNPRHSLMLLWLHPLCSGFTCVCVCSVYPVNDWHVMFFVCCVFFYFVLSHNRNRKFFTSLKLKNIVSYIYSLTWWVNVWNVIFDWKLKTL